MIWWILGGLASLYALSKVTGGDDRTVQILRINDPESLAEIMRLNRELGATPIEEKFADPIFNCLGRDILPEAMNDDVFRSNSEAYALTPNKIGYPTKHGLEYLRNSPNTADARIALMREKIRAGGPPANAATISNPTNLIDATAKLSWENFNKLSRQITSEFTIDSSVTDIAEKFGVDYSVARGYIDAVTKAAEESDAYKIVDSVVKKVPPVGKAIALAALSVATGKRLDDAAYDLAVGVVDMAAAMVPLVGQVWALVKPILEGELERQKAGRDAQCKTMLDAIAAARDKTIQAGLFVPFHADAIYAKPCPEYGKVEAAAYRDPPEHTALLELYQRNYRYFFATERGPMNTATGQDSGEFGLNNYDRTMVARWWALAQTFMSHPEVYEVFRSLGWDSFGGVLASDEQVMMVAAPIAVSRGFPVDAFARALWKRSHGWRVTNPKSAVFRKVVLYTTRPSGESDYTTVVTRGCEQPILADAWWTQWAILAKDAFELADVFESQMVKLADIKPEVIAELFDDLGDSLKMPGIDMPF